MVYHERRKGSAHRAFTFQAVGGSEHFPGGKGSSESCVRIRRMSGEAERRKGSNMGKHVCRTGQRLEIALFVSGSLTKKNKIYTKEQFASLDKSDLKSWKFSVYDNHEDRESRRLEMGTGIPLWSVFEACEADLRDEITIRSIDGFESVVSELASRRYYFPGLEEECEAEKEERSPLLSFYKNQKPVKFFPHPTMMFGQQGLHDQNKDYFAKGMRSMIIGGRDRSFWVKGDGLACNRYFSLDQLFGLAGEEQYEGEWFEITGADGEMMRVPGVKIPPRFWQEELQILDPRAPIRLIASGEPHVFDRENLYVLLPDPACKRTSAWDGHTYWEDFSGILVGDFKVSETKPEIRTGQTPEMERDFYIRIWTADGTVTEYGYCLGELEARFADWKKQEIIEYFNHNMDQGKGGIRKVTARGWLLTDLLLGLPQISDLEMIEEGSLTFRVITADSYKERVAADGDELTAFSYLLACEHDQRTKTGMEAGDTSTWEAPELHFEKVRGNTPYRIYCNKSSASPAVYKNVCGLEIQIL